MLQEEIQSPSFALAKGIRRGTDDPNPCPYLDTNDAFRYPWDLPGAVCHL